MSSRSPHRIDPAGWALLFACATSACEPELRVGSRQLDESECGASGSASVPSADKVIAAPWSTSFEEGSCDYVRAGGFCYNAADASYDITDLPVHSGQSAMAFSVTSAPGTDGNQTRCFLEGRLPADAVYGAWFYVPAVAVNVGNWNLIHFRTGTFPVLDGLWDVSLANADDGSLVLYVRDFLRGMARFPDPAPAVPIASWFHVEFRLRRAADATGEIALYQDGALILRLTSIATDSANFAQWYVGNLADGLTPADSTIYVDDVTIRPPP